MKTIEDACKEFPPLTGNDMTAAVINFLRDAEEHDGVEVCYPDWPEAAEAVERHPDKLILGPARGPGGTWRRLYWIGEPT